MPIYEYHCNHCGADLELWQKITDKPTKVCPQCGHRTLKKVISATSFHLKGSGWYVTDYGKSSQPGAKDTEAKATPKEPTSSSKTKAAKTKKKTAATSK